ncbi:MAG: hypothetical protein KKA64_03550 [Nanoarchaeota archaeon]|nr:hypothetical protein [Nanoarchaeota archaeon]
MDKTESTSLILGALYLISLIILSRINSSWILFFLGLSFVLGLLISILMCNKATKSDNSLKSKIYFSFILNVFIFILWMFFWLTGSTVHKDEFGLATILMLYVFGGCAVIGFIIGLILSIKRRKRKDFKYNLKPLSWIFSILIIVLVIIYFYNSIIFSFALSTESKELCSFTFPDLNKQNCLLRVVVEQSKTGAITCGELENIPDRNHCFRWTAQNRRDIKICIDNVISSTEILKYNEYCTSAISYLNDDIYNILKNPQHEDIMYALKSVHYSIGVCYGEEERKYIPLLKEIIKKGSLESKKEALNTLIKSASCIGNETNSLDLDSEKKFLRDEILPLIVNQPELKEETTIINQKINASVLQNQ